MPAHLIEAPGMPGGHTMKIAGLGGLCREVKGLESLGVGHRWGPGGVVGRWNTGRRRPSADYSRMNCWRVRDQAYPNSTATKNTSAPKWTMLLITLCKVSGMSNGKSPAAMFQMTSVTRFVT